MLDKEAVDKIKAEHGKELVSVEVNGQDYVFKKPSRTVWTDFIDSVTKDRSSKEIAIRRLALACAVYPKTEDVIQVFEAYPALPAKVTAELSDLAGQADSFDVKKL
jgi:hypothetical protein